MAECPIVETKLGKVKGKVLNNLEGGRKVFRYSSLPFAKPPVGELRFEPPVKPDSWQGILDGSIQSVSPQQDPDDSAKLGKFFPDERMCIKNVGEDCLYLSVYTTTASRKANLPVLVWIYGGGFMMGGESTYDGSILAALHDVVVVIPNYRLTLFGFLSLGPDSLIPGNMGLMDQRMAMEWTREHIQNFGGDPNNITIFGESAGAMSVSLHMMSPMSRDCFDKAISHSGNIHMGDFLQKADGKTVGLLLDETKITEKDPEKIVKLLKSVPAEDLIKAHANLVKKMIFFLPSVDGKLVTKNKAGLTNDQFHSKPYIVGCNSTEGSGIMSVERPPNFIEGITEEMCMGVLKGFMGVLFYKGLPDSAYDLMVKKYSKGVRDDKLKWSNIYGEISSDIMFVNPTFHTLNQHTNNNQTTYMYVMTQTPKYNHDDKYGPKQARKAPFCKCDHADDLIFTFGLPLCKGITSRFTDEERELSKEWMKYLANFAKTGNPNNGETVKIKWPLYDAKEQSYLSVQHPILTGKKFQSDRLSFWTDVIAPMKNCS